VPIVDRAAIDDVLQSAQPTLQACGSTPATLTFDLFVNDAGVVDDVVAPATDPVTTCLRTQLAWLRFSAPGTPVIVRTVVDVGPVSSARANAIVAPFGPPVRLDTQDLPEEIVEVVERQNAALAPCFAAANNVRGDGGVARDTGLDRATQLAACVRRVLRREVGEQAAELTLNFSFDERVPLAEFERTSRRLRRPLRACHVRKGARLAVTFTVDDAGRAADTDVAHDSGAVGDGFDADCVRAVVERTPWPGGAARISLPLLDEGVEPTVDAVFAEQMTRLMPCYGEALSRNSRLAGTLTLGIIVDADGLVVDVEVLPSPATAVPMVDAAMVTCAVAAVHQTVFPPSEHARTRVVYSATFRR
jgi:hypothetical protein